MTAIYRSPLAVQKIVRRHLPRVLGAVLDPAVGDGDLLGSLAGRVVHQLTCVDIVSERVNASRVAPVNSVKRRKFIQANFLELDLKEFDLILMNPPFLGKRKDFVSYEGRRVPIEVAFTLKALTHAATGARLIFVLPKTIVANESYSWVRQHLINSLRVTHVYELEAYSFHRVESNFYVLVADVPLKRPGTSTIKIIGSNGAFFSLLSSELSNSNRLDFSYWHAGQALSLLTHSPALDIVPLKELGSISRGILPSNSDEHDIHVTDNRYHRWESRSLKLENCASSQIALPSDILVRRVGRDCHLTFGPAPRKGGILSDCVIKVAPHHRGDFSRACLLFSLRTLAAEFPQLLTSGTGPQYLTKQRLERFPVIKNLATIFPEAVSEYMALLQSGAKAESLIESEHKLLIALKEITAQRHASR